MTPEYQRCRNLIFTGDLIQWSSDTALGILIRFFSRASVNHTGGAIVFKEYMDNTRRRFTLEALEHGFVLNLLSSRVNSHKGSVFWHPLKPEYDRFRTAIGREMLKFVGYGYDYRSLFRQIFGRVSADARRIFCSEAIYLSCRDADLPIPEKWEKTAPQPGDMIELGLWEEKGVQLK